MRGDVGLMGEKGETGPQGPRGPFGLVNIIVSAFCATLGYNYPAPNMPIRFENVIYNGQEHYSATTGTFTCAIPGVYFFTFNFEVNLISTYVELKKNGVTIVVAYQAYQNGYQSMAGGAIITLDVGDKVHLETSENQNGMTKISVFAGQLLFPCPTYSR
ncbi:protein HP-25 homolog 2-like [Heterodontus francisci]|uniref:protein HP-25 homolog 2-like n=1 Tax=Heterodontus francisci TaxID=7792 RepID=UPI00355C61AC